MSLPSMAVDVPELIDLLLFISVLLVLASAALSDVRNREVSDGHWVAIGSLGMIAWMASSVERGLGWGDIAITAGIGMIVFDIVWGGERPMRTSALIYGTIFVLFLLPFFTSGPESVAHAGLMALVFYVIYQLMYLTGLLRGGADAKCVISLTVAFLTYPGFWIFPLITVPEGLLSEIFVFSLSVLFYALLFSLTAVIYFLWRNIRDGNICKRMFTGYVMDIEDAMDSYVWPMDDVIDGGLKSIRIPEFNIDVYDRLISNGEKRVWVTPMIPFIVPIFVAFIFTGLVGNPLFLI